MYCRARLRQAVRRESPSVDNTAESETDALATLKGKLESGLVGHYKALQVLAPHIPANLLAPQAAHKDPIRVPSHFSSADIAALGMEDLAKLELRLRVAHGHERIEKVKSLLGVRSFATRHAKQTHGVAKNSRAQEAVRHSERKVVEEAAVYTKNWDRLKALNPPEPALEGLQELKSSDLKLLGTWLEEEQYRRGGTDLPWFWSLRPLPAGPNGTPVDLETQVKEWNEEGTPHCSPP